MNGTLKGFVAASIVLGAIAPTVFASPKSAASNYHFSSKTIAFGNYNVKADGFAAFDGTSDTTYMPIWYVIQGLKAAGYTADWNGTTHTFTIQAPASVTPNFDSVHIGKDITKITLNGTEIETAPTLVAKDPASGKDTTYMPIYYVQYSLENAQVHSQWDGTTWNIAQTSGTNVEAVKPSVGVGQPDTVTAVLKDMQGNAIIPSQTTFQVLDENGNPTTDAVIDQNTGVFVATKPGTYLIKASADRIVGSAKVTVYGQAAGMKVAAASPTIVANGKSTSTITVTAVDSNGNLAPDYNGTATVSADGNGTSFATTNQASDFDGTTLLFKNGQATFVAQAGTVPGLASNYTVSMKLADGSTQSQKVTLTTVPQTATALKVTPEDGVQYVQANAGNNPAKFDVTVVDQDGQPMLSGVYPYSIAVTGAGSYNGNTSGVFVGGTAPTPITVLSEQGVQGAINVSATGAGLTSGTASVTAVIAEATSKVSAVAEGGNNSFAEGSNEVFDLSAADANGVPTALPDGLIASFKDANGRDASGILSGNIAAGKLTVSDKALQADAGTYSVVISDAQGKVWATFPVIETAADASQLIVGTPSAYVTQAAPSTTVNVHLVDQYGNAVAKSGIPITFSVKGNGTGTATVNGTATASVNTDANGNAQVSVAAQPYAGELFTVTAAADASAKLTQASGTASFTVEPTVAQSASVTLSSAAGGSIVTAGQPVNGNITLKDQFGNAVSAPQTITITTNDGIQSLTSFKGATVVKQDGNTYTLTTDGGSISFTGTAAKAGTASLNVTDTSIAPGVTGNATVSVTADSHVAGYDLFAANGQEITSNNPLSVTGNVPVQVTLKPVDSEGNPIIASNDAVVTLQDTNQNGQFRLDGSNVTATTAQIKAGSAGVTLWYVNAQDAKVTLSAKVSN